MRYDEVNSLARLQEAKQSNGSSLLPLGAVMVDFFKQDVRKRQMKLVFIAERWMELVPESLSEHCALDSLRRGTLTVLVDGAPCLYELRQLLLAGLQGQLLLACRASGLRKIVLKPGRADDRRRPSYCGVRGTC
jgi:Dna[CI] antecedent, DciA